MSNTQLIDTIRMQQDQISRLKEELKRVNSTNYENKYKKALKDISSIIKANRELKDELDKFRIMEEANNEKGKQIEKDQFQKAYENLLKEKSKMNIQLQNLSFENEKLKYSAQSLEQYISQLKGEQMSLAREKEALERNYNKRPNQEGKPPLIDSKQLILLKQKENDYLRRIQEYQEHHTQLNKSNRKLQITISELQNKIQKLESNWQSSQQLKSMQIQEIKSQIKKQYQEQITFLKSQNSELRNQIHDLTLSVQKWQFGGKMSVQGQKQYEIQLIETLRELKGQMEPLKIQISQMSEGKEYQKQNNLRQKTNLKLKIIEVQNEIQQKNNKLKEVQKKLIIAQEEVRRQDQQHKIIKRLEEENRILGGRVIVLESKDIALKNRTGEDLEERVIQFQNRVHMLLQDRETISNLKNVTIHQLIALKTYIMELDSKLEAITHENQYLTKKYKNYKEKYITFSKQLQNHQSIIESYKLKIGGYDKLILKLQGQCQRLMSMYDIELKSFHLKSLNSELKEDKQMSIQVYKKKNLALKQKLQMQERYSKQQIQTIKLNYDTKLMEVGITIQQVKALKDTIKLYKAKNDQLMAKLNKKDNQIFQIKLSSSQIKVDNPTDQRNSTITKHTKQLVNSLNITISQKQALLLKMQNDFRFIESGLKRKCANLQEQIQKLQAKIQNNSQLRVPIDNSKQLLEDRIYSLEQELRRSKKQVIELQGQLNQNVSKSQISKTDDAGKVKQLIQKVSKLNSCKFNF